MAERRFRSQLGNDMIGSRFQVGLRWNGGTSPGAQTERRGGAGPAGACLAVRTPPAALLDSRLSATPGLRKRIDEVVVAGRGVDGEDHREHVKVEQPETVFASSDLFA